MKQKYLIISLLLFLIFTTSAGTSAAENINIHELLKKAQQNNRKIHETIDNMKFSVRSKTYIYFGFGPFNVNLIPMFEEYYADGYWEKPDSIRLDIHAARIIHMDESKKKKESSSVIDSLKNHLSTPSPFLFDYNIIGIKNNNQETNKRPYYPFADSAEMFYNYEVIGEIRSGMMDVVELRVIPKHYDVPAVIGTFMLDKNSGYVVSSDFEFNDAAKLSVKFQKKKDTLSVSAGIGKRGEMKKMPFVTKEHHKVSVKKAFYYRQFYLPETMEEEFYIGLLGMKIKINRVLEFSSYEINIPKFKEIRPAKKIIYTPDKQMQDSLLSEPEYASKLSKKEEEEIIKRVENDILSGELFGDLTDVMADIAEESVKQGIRSKVGKYLYYGQKISDFLRYNRVEGPYIGFDKKTAGRYLKKSAFSGSIGYGFEDYKWKWELAFLKLFGRKNKLFIDAKVYDKLGFEEKNISGFKNSFSSFVFNTDYRDYYGIRGFSAGLGYKFDNNFGSQLHFVSQKEISTPKNTDFSLFSRGTPFRINPGIFEGTYNGLEFSTSYKTYRFNTELNIKYTDKNFLKSDFDYSLLRLKSEYRWRPTYQSNLYLTVNGGISSGTLSPQRWFDFGGKIFGIYRGELSGAPYKYFTGDKMASGVLEYHMNGKILRKIGIRYPLQSITKLILWTGAAYSELSDKNKTAALGLLTSIRTTKDTYTELGIGISDRLNILRFDLIHSNVDNKIMVGFNILR